jgi:ribonuclease HI
MRAKPPGPVIDDEAINLFVDGSMYPTPRRGGVGIVLVVVNDEGHEVDYTYPRPGYEGATNNLMELVACIEALQWITGKYSPVGLASYKRVVIFTDSMYVAENYQLAKFTWSRNGWMTKDGNPVRHAPQWKQLIGLDKKVGKRLEVRWSKGHSSANPKNKAADKLAKASAKGPLQKPLAPIRVRRKHTDEAIEPGGVKLEGQRLHVRIISDQLLKPQNILAVQYEVKSESSPYYGKADVIYVEPNVMFEAEIVLGAGHEYEVRVNDEQERPRIVEVFREIKPVAESA